MKLDNKKTVFLLLFTLYAAICIGKTLKPVSYRYRNDTLYSMLGLCAKEKEVNKAFFKIYGTSISSDYDVLDSLKIDINNDSIKDLIVIFSPKIQQLRIEKSPCYFQKYDRRLLAIFLSNKNGFVLKCINENLILNRFEYQNEPFIKMEHISNGILLKYYIGSSLKCDYNFYFNVHNNNLFFVKKEYNCYLINLSEREKKNINILSRKKMH
ncbi:hypothetical protein ACTHGU_04760 [Chitinophagaceae bacterium MMS25-I14]